MASNATTVTVAKQKLAQYLSAPRLKCEECSSACIETVFCVECKLNFCTSCSEKEMRQFGNLKYCNHCLSSSVIVGAVVTMHGYEDKIIKTLTECYMKHEITNHATSHLPMSRASFIAAFSVRLREELICELKKHDTRPGLSMFSICTCIECKKSGANIGVPCSFCKKVICTQCDRRNKPFDLDPDRNLCNSCSAACFSIGLFFFRKEFPVPLELFTEIRETMTKEMFGFDIVRNKLTELLP